jgi:hypothetical protein
MSMSSPTSRRAEALAKRIEDGAEALAAFAQGLTAEQWRVPVSATDKRPVGVIVHHVAFMYPIEVDVTRKVSRGEDATDVTWEVVAGINETHARENARATKEAALALLQENSRAAAEDVRRMTDEELDRAAPFGLTFGAPMTAQFVIEDHTMRHAWHHLARIRKAVGRSAGS